MWQKNLFKMQNNFGKYPTYQFTVTTKLVLNYEIIKVYKRTMLLSKIHCVIFRKEYIPLKKLTTANMSTFNTFDRKAQPIKLTAAERPSMEEDPDTGLQIMHGVDYSGYNHILLGDIDYISEKFILILGSFTSSTYPFNNKDPIFISEINLHGESKQQYFHLYDKPRLILKSEVEQDLIAALFLPSKTFLDDIINAGKTAPSW